ncbi:MAG TPA: hypothetical protein VHE59_16265 [Mucilaginibacter sp.]|nr:hypothetical protein [Mucilaginibacter sp.]
MAKKGIIFIVLSVIVFSSCVEGNNKAVNYQPIHIIFVALHWSQDSVVSPDIVSLVKPIKSGECGENQYYIGYDGHLHFKTIVGDSIESKDVDVKESIFDRHWFGEPSAEKKSEEIEKYLSEINLSNLFPKKVDSASKDQLLYKLSKYFSQNPQDSIFILRKSNDENMFTGIRSFKNLDSLKKAIADQACKTKVRSFIIILETNETEVQTGLGIASPKNGLSSDLSGLKNMLLSINRLNSESFTQRKTAVDKITDKYFADQFTISLNYGAYNDQVAKTFNTGRDYLDQLASNKHLSDIQVKHADKDANGKITHIDVVEIQKNDIDVHSK